MRGVQTLVPLVYLSVLLAEPAPSSSTDTTRRCQGRCPPSPPSRGSGCPQLQSTAATAEKWRSLTSTRSNSASRRTISVTHNSFGASRWNLRLTRSSALATPRSDWLSLVFVVVLARHTENDAATINGCPGVNESVDHRVNPFGRGLSSPKSVGAWRTIANSVSSSRIRRRAARSSVDSLDGTPGRRPWSMSSRLIHFDNVTA